MKFIQTNWDDSCFFDDNLKNLASNLFRIKFYFQEDQLEAISMISDLETKNDMLLTYQKISDEVTIYLKVVSAFLNKNATVESDMDALKAAISYFEDMQSNLGDEEISNPVRYKEWLKNHEYY